jgi:hypothetical protein
VLLADVIVIFISSQLLTASYETSLRVLSAAIETSHASLAALYYTRRMNYVASGIAPEPIYNITEQVDYWRGEITSTLSEISELEQRVLRQFSSQKVKGS